MIFNIVMIILFSLFSTAILSYISMAVALGPWMESTIVLLASLVMVIAARTWSIAQRNESLVYITAGASVGSMVATGCAFAFPTLYFLDAAWFTSIFSNFWHFFILMAGISLLAGGLAIVLANIFEKKLIEQDALSFPVGELAYKLITAQNNLQKAVQLGVGFLLSSFYCIGMWLLGFAKRIMLVPPITYKYIKFCGFSLPLVELPMLWAIGFIAGHVIAVPLLVGLLINILILTPAHGCYFSYLNPLDFNVAFASGIVVYGALMSLLDLPKLAVTFLKNRPLIVNAKIHIFNKNMLGQWIVLLAIMMVFLSNVAFSLPSQFYLLVCTIACAYQLAIIGGKIGMAPMGRFATMVMMPGLFIFGYDALQVTIVATFVEVCGGVVVDVLFGRKMAYMAGVDRKKVIIYQWLGLLVSALSIGIFFWLLINNLGLGTEKLIAQRARLRALLLGVQKFDFFALILGALVGAILKDFKLNPVMVLGGILMNPNWSFILVISGLSTYLCKDCEEQYPLWSGVFAANSLWMIVQALL